jgi:hypothetical protein
MTFLLTKRTLLEGVLLLVIILIGILVGDVLIPHMDDIPLWLKALLAGFLLVIGSIQKEMLEKR